MNQQNIAFFDIDGTLYRGNSTFDFIAYVNQRNNSYIKFRKIYRVMKIYNKICMILLRYDWYKKQSVKFLKDYSRAELLILAEQFYNDCLQSQVISNTLDLYNFYQSKGYKMVLLTATLDPIAEVLKDKLKADEYFATHLVFDVNERCTGCYVSDLLHHKLDLVVDKFELDKVNSIFFSDNHQDITLLKKVNLGALLLNA